MRMKHTVKFNSGRQKVFEFKSISQSNKVLENAVCLNRTFNNIKCIWVESVNQP